MAREKKITWKMIYKDFQSRQPRLKKEVIHWCPYDYLTIEIWFKDGSRITYTYPDGKFKFIRLAAEERR